MKILTQNLAGSLMKPTKSPNCGWAAFSGVVTFALGILLWAQWPVFAGISWSAIALKLKNV